MSWVYNFRFFIITIWTLQDSSSFVLINLYILKSSKLLSDPWFTIIVSYPIFNISFQKTTWFSLPLGIDACIAGYPWIRMATRAVFNHRSWKHDKAMQILRWWNHKDSYVRPVGQKHHIFTVVLRCIHIQKAKIFWYSRRIQRTCLSNQRDSQCWK